MLEPYQKKIIEMLYKQERLLALLYKTFSEKYSDYNAFWIDLATDELKHASWIKKLYQLEKKDLVLFHEDKIKTYTLETYIAHLEEVLDKAKNMDMPMIEAIVYTIDFETSLIEKNVFKHFDHLTEDTAGILRTLVNETKAHIEKVKAVKRELESAPE